MAEEIASKIKGIHLDLRNTCQNAENEEVVKKAWTIHTKNEKLLSNYAEFMSELSEKHWENRPENQNRNFWIKNTLNKYFIDGDNLRLFNRLARKTGIEISVENNSESKLKVLDVGSCYNPLKNVNFLDVAAIDIAPHNPGVTGVKKCDFINVPLDSEGEEFSLPTNHYNCVIFSLLLDYLPIPSMRYEACSKAGKVLITNGILIIIAPDSSHQQKNMKYLRSWKICLSLLGFNRTYYEKLPHIHCMAFTKLDSSLFNEFCLEEAKKEAGKLNLNLDDINPITDLMIIPQDVNYSKPPEKVDIKNENTFEINKDLFDVLPNVFN